MLCCTATGTRCGAAAADYHHHWHSSSKLSSKMHPSSTPAHLIHRTTIALTQLHRLLQQATDILANLHNLYLLHTGQVDPNFNAHSLHCQHLLLLQSPSCHPLPLVTQHPLSLSDEHLDLPILLPTHLLQSHNHPRRNVNHHLH